MFNLILKSGAVLHLHLGWFYIGHISYDETSALIEGFRTLILRIGRSRRLYKKCKPNEKLCNLEVLKQGDSLQLEV